MTPANETAPSRPEPPLMEGVSVLLPLRDDAEALPAFFDNLGDCEVLEVLACDCGSRDGSAVLARQAGAHVFRASGGEAAAMNEMARHARGSALWALRPDCLPPRMAGVLILDILALPGVRGGYFPVTPRETGAATRFAAWRRNLSARLLGRIDRAHAPFFSRAAFRSAGGWPDDPPGAAGLMRRIRRKGGLYRAPEPVRVSFGAE